MMTKEYATVVICKVAKETKETTSYYILEEEKYGLKILKSSSSKETKEEEIIIHNISNDEKVVEDMLDTIISNSNDISQISYIIEDLLNQDNSKQDSRDESKKNSLV